MSACPSEEVLKALLGNQLDPAEAAALRAHVEACDTCLDRLAAQTAAEEADRLKGLLTDSPVALPETRAAVAPPAIAGYRDLVQIGRGGSAVVYRAVQDSTGRPVAVKLYDGAGRPTAAHLARFHREVQVLIQLAHPNVIQALDAGEASGRPFVVLEYLPGGTLKRQWAERPQPPRTVAELVGTLARAVHVLHTAVGGAIVHRDLKPSNVLLTADGQPKIADFGFALLVPALGQPSPTSLTATAAILGTLEYMAPEQASGKRAAAVGPPADVYALGVILYEGLTGRPPFRGEAPMDIIDQVLREEPIAARRLEPKVPRDLETICLKCLQKEPRRRYASAGELADDLDRFLNRQPIRARPVGPVQRLVLRCRRNPRQAVLEGGAGLLLTAVVLLASLVLLARQEGRYQAALVVQAEQERAYRDVLVRARTAAGRGDWRSALELYGQLIAGAYCPDRPRLAVERLPGFLAVNDRTRFAEEIARFAARDDLGPDRAQVKLLQGEFLLSQADGHEAGRRLIDEALAASGQLSEPDRAYAEALTTPNSNRVTALLKEAITRAPFHHRANRAYLMARVVRGEFEEAHRQAEFMRLHFPDDPLTDYADALLAVLEKDPDHRAADLAKLACLDQKLGPEARARLEGDLKKLAELLDGWYSRAAAPGGLKGTTGQAQAVLEVANLGAEPLTLGLPIASLLTRTLEQIADCDKALREINPQVLTKKELQAIDELLARLTACSLESPDAVFLSMRGVLHVHRARPHLDAGRVAEFRREMQAALDVFERTRTAPTLLPRSPMRYQALTMAVVAEVVLLRARAEPTPVQLGRLRANCTRLINEGRVWPHLRPQATDMVLLLLTDEPSTALRKDWQLEQPANREQYEARQRFLYEFGRWLLTQWQQDAPQDPAPALRLAKLELTAGNLDAALRAARQVLVLSPGHKEALDLEQQALRRMRERPRE